MNLRPLLLTLTSVMITGLQAAETWELKGGAAFSDRGPFETTRWQTGLEYYLEPLNHSGPEPLAEAAFVERPRALRFGVEDSQIKIDDTGEDTSESLTSFEAGYIHRSARSPHVMSASYTYTDVAYRMRFIGIGSPNATYRLDGDEHAVDLGYDYYLLPRLTLGFDGTYHYLRTSRDGDGTDLETLGATAHLRYLVPLGGQQWFAVSAEGGRTEVRATYRFSQWPDSHFSYDFTHFGTTLTYYPTRHTSLAATWSHESYSDSDMFGARIEHFVTERVAVSLSVQRTDFGFGSDEDLVAVGLRCRF